MAVYFTADLHLGEERTMRLFGRPWSHIEEYDAAIIAGINARVGVDDELYILGDVTRSTDEARIRAWLEAIVCKNRHLVFGNHDYAPAFLEPWAFVDCAHYREITVAGHLCCLSHYPMLDWNKGDAFYDTHDPALLSLMLHGHVHSRGQTANAANARKGIRRYDVGVDANAFLPVSFEEIWEFLAQG